MPMPEYGIDGNIDDARLDGQRRRGGPLFSSAILSAGVNLPDEERSPARLSPRHGHRRSCQRLSSFRRRWRAWQGDLAGLVRGDLSHLVKAEQGIAMLRCDPLDAVRCSAPRPQEADWFRRPQTEPAT